MRQFGDEFGQILETFFIEFGTIQNKFQFLNSLTITECILNILYARLINFVVGKVQTNMGQILILLKWLYSEPFLSKIVANSIDLECPQLLVGLQRLCELIEPFVSYLGTE